MKLSPRGALTLFIVMAVTLFGQAVWWVIYMAHLLNEKVDMVQKLGASQDFITQIHQEEIHRQIMLGFEGIFFFVVILLGAWIIYRALVRSEELKFHQQNFLMAVTHELKTPIASVKVYLDTLQSPKISHETKERVIPRIKEDITRLERLVENVLDAGRFERSGYDPDKTMFDLTELISNRLDALSRTGTSIPLTIEHSLQQQVYCYGDSNALGRAIDAVLENCLKYHKGERITIRVNLISDEDQIKISISDDGIGFEKKESNALFDRFYRVGSELTRSQSGSGLGLFLCREIIRAHNGDVSAHSEGHGKGAAFTITLKREKGYENDTAG